MSNGGYGGPTGQYDGDWFAAEPYPQPLVISAPPMPPSQKTNTFATLSLIFAFLFAPAGAVLGHLGLAQIRRTGERGKDRALIGLTLSYAFILVAVVALVIWLVVGQGSGAVSGRRGVPCACNDFSPFRTSGSSRPLNCRSCC